MSHPQHDLDVYPVRMHLVSTRKQLREHASEVPLAEGADPAAAGFSTATQDMHSGVLHVTVWLNAKWHRRHGHDARDTVVHEAVHAGGQILDHFGQPYDGQSEALAYLVEWITRWLQTALDG